MAYNMIDKLVLCADSEHIFIGKLDNYDTVNKTCYLVDARLITPGEGVTITLDGIISMATNINTFKEFCSYMSSPSPYIVIPTIKYIFVVDDSIKSTYTVATKSDMSIIKERNEENKPDWAKVAKVNKSIDWRTAGSFM